MESSRHLFENIAKKLWANEKEVFVIDGSDENEVLENKDKIPNYIDLSEMVKIKIVIVNLTKNIMKNKKWCHLQSSIQ